MGETEDMETRVEALARAYVSVKYRYANEKELQSQLDKDLGTLGWDLHREKHLGDGNIIDFYDPYDGIGIELKVSAPFGETLNQCYRYMKSDIIHGLVLMTPSRRLFHAFQKRVPRTLHGKPIWALLIRGEL